MHVWKGTYNISSFCEFLNILLAKFTICHLSSLQNIFSFDLFLTKHFRDPMLESLAKKLEITYSLNKYRSREMKYQEAGLLKPQISLTKYVFTSF